MSGIAKGAAGPIPAPRRDYAHVRAIVTSPAFLPGIAIAGGILAAFWDLLRTLPELYLDNDGYYSHGFFLPLTAIYVIHKNWPKLKTLPVKPAYWVLAPLLATFLLLRVVTITEMFAFMSIMLAASMLLGVWFVAGLRWMKAVTLPILYLLLGLPIWSMAINTYTNPLQLLSTKAAYTLLELTGFRPYRDGTTIRLNHFNLDVGIPCSGLKLVVALTAFTAFFMMIARLRAWANVLLAALILPMALLFNGLRIAAIGMVGEIWGEAAGRQFHDYSGYLMLIVCFFTFFKLARWLGWKD
ncbi:MAG TPA: exosortase/archaeosortase family protein [Fimbriimonas sp.]|nr:exosortase/archaeosortase family protein [Fimbriimonas sp.]